MAVIQVPLIVPDELAPQVVAGTLKITGAVLRNNKGRIVKHLPTTTLKAKQAVQVAAKGAVNVVKAHPVAAAGVTAGAIVIGGGTYLVRSRTKRNPAVKQLEYDLLVYIEQLQEQNLTLDTIESLLDNLNKVQEKFDLDEVKFKLSAKQINALITVTYQYTTALAEANNVELGEISRPDNIINLEEYLKIQRDIFKRAI